MFLSALREIRQDSPGATGTKPATRSRDVPELRLLENGREDRTPVRAVRRGSRSRPALRSNCLSIHAAGSLPVAETISQIVRVAGIIPPVRTLANQSFGRHGNRRGDRQAFVGEFDPGSGRTLAACLTHASRTGSMELAPEDLVANGCVTREKPAPDLGITVGNDC